MNYIHLDNSTGRSIIKTDQFGIAYRLGQALRTYNPLGRGSAKEPTIELNTVIDVQQLQNIVNEELNPEAIEVKDITAYEHTV